MSYFKPTLRFVGISLSFLSGISRQQLCNSSVHQICSTSPQELDVPTNALYSLARNVCHLVWSAVLVASTFFSIAGAVNIC